MVADKLNMKTFLFSLAILSTGCSSMHLQYDADIKTEQGIAHYTFQKSYSTSGMAWACGFTAIFYGGACWAYKSKPWNSEEEQLASDAKVELMSKYKVSQFEINTQNISRLEWDRRSTGSNLIYYANPAKVSEK